MSIKTLSCAQLGAFQVSCQAVVARRRKGESEGLREGSGQFAKCDGGDELCTCSLVVTPPSCYQGVIGRTGSVWQQLTRGN